MSKIAVSSNPSGTGTFTIASPATNTDRVLTLPDEAGTVLTSATDIAATGTNVIQNAGALFEAKLSSDQTLTAGTHTKLQMSTELLDLDGSYDPSTNYRFQPTISGYYQINAQVYMSGSLTESLLSIYKNGSRHKDGIYISIAHSEIMLEINALVELNGSTDYLEIYALGATSSGSPTVNVGGEVRSRWSGYLVRKS